MFSPLRGVRDRAKQPSLMVVIVHGYDGSGPGHWQRWLEGELRVRNVPVVMPDLPTPTAPRKDAWVAALERIVATAASPVTFVCHSLGCWAVDHLLAEGAPCAVHAALLVAPPSPFLLFEPIESFLPPPRRPEVWAPLAARTLIVGGDNDDFTTPEEFAALARQIGVGCHIVEGAGHVNVASGFGPWPFALEWLRAVGVC